MKKVLLTAAAVFAFGFANAQEGESTIAGFSKGDVFVTGGVGFNSDKQGDWKSNEFTFSPAVGYFVSDNIALGARLNVMSGKSEFGSSEEKSSAFGAEAFGRYYMTPASKFSLFGELAVGFGSSKEEDVFGDETKYNAFGVNAGIGVNYFLSSNWALEASWAGLGYNTFKEDTSGAESYDTFGLNVDLSSINLGLVYKF
ncbi:outer membrane beta-barrel protein [Flavobacterium chuncheonense]|uniref:Outer membrane beta-barrel protein n=1 Tax=Flavobacterium chuncheonense TaxID=2026653 RepID=A0ABW5YJZ7_9FLAO